MQESLVAALRVRRPQIRARWEDLLRVERANTPLAHPDSLVHLLEWTLDEFFATLASLPSRRRAARAGRSPACPCGRNPLLAYFAAGEQALRESLVLAQAQSRDFSPFARDTALLELDQALQQISRREIDAFCAVCQFRPAETAVGLAVPADSGAG